MNRGQFEEMAALLSEVIEQLHEIRRAQNRIDGRLKDFHTQIADERIHKMIEELLIQVLIEAGR